MEPRERAGRPPVRTTEELHGGGDEEGAHHARVDRDRERHPETDRLDDEDIRKAEGGEDTDDDRGGPRDKTAAALKTLRDGGGIVAEAAVFLLDAREEEHLVVHRKAEDEAEHHHRQRRIEGSGRGEPELLR